MIDENKEAKEFLRTEKMRLMAESLKHFTEIKQENTTLEALADGFRSTIEAALDGTTKQLDTLLTEQVYMLDTVFLGCLRNSQRRAEPINSIAVALKAQRQSQSTIKTLRDLQQKRFDTITKLEREFMKEKKKAEKKQNYAEQNEQKLKIRQDYPDDEVFHASLD